MQPDLEYLYALERFGIKLGLDVMEALMKRLGNPHLTFKSIHITGTNGKGSTAAMLESMLRTAGYTTALYTSPHLLRFNERIRVAGVPITDDELAQLITLVKEASDGLEPTFFEFTTALAFLYFARQDIDIAIIEVGMGGTLDATNVLKPAVGVITNIGHDHEHLLGKTTLEISARKAGIIKEGMSIITAEADPAILALFERQCALVGATFHRITEVSASSERGLTQTFTYQNHPYEIPLLGAHQITNATTALTVLNHLEHYEIPLKARQEGMKNVVWEGRLQAFSEEPLILLDGAHNEEGMQALHRYVQELPTHDILIIGMKEDKHLPTLYHKIVPLYQEVIITKGNYHPAEPAEIAKHLTHQKITLEPILKNALAYAIKKLNAGQSLLITGSLYLIGDALKELQEQRSGS